MTITLDQGNLGGNNVAASGSAITLTTTQAIAAGATGLFPVSHDGGATTCVGSGGGGVWAASSDSSQVSGALGLNLVRGYFPAGLASGSTLTFTLGAARTNVAVTGSSFLGIESVTSPIDSGTTNTGTTTAHTTGNVTANVAGDLVIGAAVAWSTSAGGNTASAPSLKAVDYNAVASDKYLTLGYRIETSAGAVPVAGTWGANPFTTVDLGVSYKAAATAPVASPSPLLRMLVQGGLQRAKALMLLKPQPAVVSLDQSVGVTGLSNPAQFGAVSIIQDQFISVAGFQDATQFGTFRVDQTVPVVGFQDAAQFGTVAVNDTVSVAGFQDAAQFGVVSVDQTVPISGFQDSAQFGGPVPSQTVNLTGFSSPAQFGLVTIDTGTGPAPTTLRNRSTMGAGE